MAFSDFQYPDVLQQLGLTEASEPDLFAGVSPVAPGPLLRSALPVGTRLGPGAHSEVSRAIWMVGPVLGELWDRYHGQISLIGGAEFTADPAAGLSGYCDFIISRGPQRPVVGPPILVIFEAKRDSIPDGLGQCIAGVVGAQRYNRRHNAPADPMYGCITTGSLWRFIRLSGTTLTHDQTEYTIQQADKLLGILTHIVGPVPPSAAA